MTKLRLGILALVGLASAGLVLSPAIRSWASGFFTNGLPVAGGTQYPTTLPLTGSEQLPADTQLSGGQSPQSEAITVGQLGTSFAPSGLPRNFLLNGDMAINQQGTTSIVGGTTTIQALQFSADRWFVDTNVTSGTGKSTVKTTSPAPPTGFTQEITVFRNSATLTQPVCMIQEIETTRSTQLAGQYVVLSALLDQLAGLTAPANVVSGYVIYGTGTDQGLATLTASPAITPAWTGIGATSAAGASTTIAAAGTWTISTTWTRYNTPPVLIPTTATEVGVEICFTPGTETAGATDGFAMTGVQLEPVLYSTAALGSPGPSPFEFRNIRDELADCERFFYQLNEPASTAQTTIVGMAESTSVQSLTLPLPVTMRGTTPVVLIPTTGTFAEMIATTPTTWVTPTAGVCSVTACQILTANTTTALAGITVAGGGGTGKVYVKHDVVF